MAQMVDEMLVLALSMKIHPIVAQCASGMSTKRMGGCELRIRLSSLGIAS